MTEPSPLYGHAETERYPAAAPHLRHAAVRSALELLVGETLVGIERPRVLELGAGGGAATAMLLDHGAHVTAVESSHHQIAVLTQRLGERAERLEVRHADATEELQAAAEKFDAAVAVSFLHHIPDYLELLELTVARLKPVARVLTFQDPLLHASLRRRDRVFASAAYGVWRLGQGDVRGGLARRLRRRRGVWLEDCPQDVIEYHATRGGVDQHAVAELLKRHGFETRCVQYFSTQSRMGQRIGSTLRLVNTFAIVARRG